MNPILSDMTRGNINQVTNLVQLAKGNPEAMFNNMMRNNPRFSQFVNENRGMSPEQIASKYGIGMDQVSNIMRG